MPVAQTLPRGKVEGECSFSEEKGNSQAAKKGRTSFCEQKEAKNFDNFWPVALQRPREAEQKFFGSFFQKRTPCFYLLF
jgi:hypothetical protein